MADQSGALEVKRFDEIRQIVGIGVHLVAIPGLARPAMAATIMGDAAAVVGRQEHHLAFPSIGAERPAVAENDGLSCAPVLVVDLRTILRVKCAHLAVLSLYQWGLPTIHSPRFELSEAASATLPLR